MKTAKSLDFRLEPLNTSRQMRTNHAASPRKRPAGPSRKPLEVPLALAPAIPEPPAEPERSSEPVREAALVPETSAPPARRWHAPRAENWERREGFRATLLLHLPTRRERASYRRMGQMLYDAVLARSEEAEETPAEFAFRQMEAMLSELRFLEGFAADVADLHDLDDEETVARLGRCARTLGKRFSRFADGLAKTLEAEADLLGSDPPPSSRPDSPASGS